MVILVTIGLIVLLILVATFIMQKKSKERGERMDSIISDIPGFTPTIIINDNYDNRYRFLADNTSKRVCIIIEDVVHLVDYEEIIKVDFMENSISIMSKSTSRTIGGALGGALIAGGVGAIVGGLSGDAKSIKKIDKVGVNILIRDVKSPSINLVTFDSLWTGGNKPVKASDAGCQIGIENAKKIADVVSVIIDEVDKGWMKEHSSLKQEKPVQLSTSVADEIKKLAQLKEEGILTEEEFNKQKAILLS